MTKVTREMIAAAHDVTMRHKIVLGHELLTEIYQAMDAKREFVGLTEEDLAGCDESEYKAALYWDAKLREKNA